MLQERIHKYNEFAGILYTPPLDVIKDEDKATYFIELVDKSISDGFDYVAKEYKIDKERHLEKTGVFID